MHLSQKGGQSKLMVGLFTKKWSFLSDQFLSKKKNQTMKHYIMPSFKQIFKKIQWKNHFFFKVTSGVNSLNWLRNCVKKTSISISAVTIQKMYTPATSNDCCTTHCLMQHRNSEMDFSATISINENESTTASWAIRMLTFSNLNKTRCCDFFYCTLESLLKVSVNLVSWKSQLQGSRPEWEASQY